MARVKTFTSSGGTGGSIFPDDLNAIQDEYDGRLAAIETTGKLWQPGDLKATAKLAPDTGWLICDGSLISRTAYATLFAAIGTTWGAGDGSTTFKLPDLSGRVPVGRGTATGAAGATAKTLGQLGGEETHTLSVAEMPSHRHRAALSNASGSSLTISKGISTAGNLYEDTNAFGNAHIENTGSGAAHNNLPPFAGVTWTIKT